MKKKIITEYTFFVILVTVIFTISSISAYIMEEFPRLKELFNQAVGITKNIKPELLNMLSIYSNIIIFGLVLIILVNFITRNIRRDI